MEEGFDIGVRMEPGVIHERDEELQYVRNSIWRFGLVFLLIVGALSFVRAPVEGQDEDGVETLTGSLTVNNPFILSFISEADVLLTDLTAYVVRDRDLPLPLESQVIGPLEDDLAIGASYSLELPDAPKGTINDLDNGQGDGAGVQLYALDFWTNLTGDPYLGPQEGSGWSDAMSSLNVTVGDGDVVGGTVIVWAPDDRQLFPTGLGNDGIFLTADDPVGPIPAGWTVVDLDESPFIQLRTDEVEVPIIEGDDGFTDYGDRTFTEAFDALFAELRLRYPFTELKGIDWAALEMEYRPRIEQAQAGNDLVAFNLALRDFVFEFNDGHVSTTIPEETWTAALDGRLGMRLAETDGGEVIVISVTEGLPADQAGIVLGAEVTAWNGQPAIEAVGAEPPLLTASTEHARRVQQYEFLTRGTLGDQVQVAFVNPEGVEQTATLTYSDDIDGRDMAANEAISYGDFDEDQPPVDAEVLDSGIGYVKINTFAADPLQMTTAWEETLTTSRRTASRR